MQAFRDADRQVGGGYVYGAVIRYLEHEVAPHLFTGTSDTFSAAAALTEMAGWMAHDAGDDTIAPSSTSSERSDSRPRPTTSSSLPTSTQARATLRSISTAHATGYGSRKRGERSCAAAITTRRSRLACTRWRPARLPRCAGEPTAPGCSSTPNARSTESRPTCRHRG